MFRSKSLLIKCKYQPTIPRKRRNSLTFVDGEYLRTGSIFVRSGLSLSGSRTKPRYVIHGTQNSHFLNSAFNPAFQNLTNTNSQNPRCRSKSSFAITMSSRYTNTFRRSSGSNKRSTRCWNIIGAFISLNGIVTYCRSPEPGIKKTVYRLLDSSIGTWWAYLRLIFVRYLEHRKLSNMGSMLDNVYTSRSVTLFRS